MAWHVSHDLPTTQMAAIMACVLCCQQKLCYMEDPASFDAGLLQQHHHNSLVSAFTELRKAGEGSPGLKVACC
jgi:hypothetical protein